MNLVRLIYASRMTPSCGPKELKQILDISRKKNEAKGITGVLGYDSETFLQCLEGAQDVVNELYRTIIMDERHKDVTLIGHGSIDQRNFEKWSMAYLNVEDYSKDVAFKFGVARKFDPFSMNETQAMAFLVHIVTEHQGFLEEQLAKMQKSRS